MGNRKFRKLPIRRSIGSTDKCLCSVDAGLSATAFPKPAESVVRASQETYFTSDTTYLEIGGGNLRNALFIQQKFGPLRMVVVERQSVINRFSGKYADFRSAGGIVGQTLPRGRFDVIIATYVLETICPAIDRELLLSRITNAMSAKSRLLLSVRGYPGVRGKCYRRCPHSDGWVSPRGAFVRAYSLRELDEFLQRHGLAFTPLQRYRAGAPENIHGIARLADR